MHEWSLNTVYKNKSIYQNFGAQIANINRQPCLAMQTLLHVPSTALSGNADPLARADLRSATQIYLINLKIDLRVWHRQTSTARQRQPGDTT